uniref:Putative secreted protein n=1 Tax=Anopheles marajoara TaxID=58244 RepID=A0A2M4CAE6_9DIPT
MSNRWACVCVCVMVTFTEATPSSASLPPVCLSVGWLVRWSVGQLYVVVVVVDRCGRMKQINYNITPLINTCCSLTAHRSAASAPLG